MRRDEKGSRGTNLSMNKEASMMRVRVRFVFVAIVADTQLIDDVRTEASRRYSGHDHR
jgi:hypothetical protein